jgi:DNA polymerase-3 subunit alpha
VDGIAAALKRARGTCPVFVSVKDPAGKSAQFKLNGDYAVDPVKVPVDELEMILGKGQVIFTR